MATGASAREGSISPDGVDFTPLDFVVRFGLAFALALAACASSEERPASVAAQPTATVLALGVVLEPDATMVAAAKAANARLREDDPLGFALDASHAPHITLVQRFVRASDVLAIAEAVAAVLASERPAELRLTARGYGMSRWAGVGILSYKVEHTPELSRLEERIVRAVQPFAVDGGGAEAFVTSAPDEESSTFSSVVTPSSPAIATNAQGREINAETIEWVRNYVPAATGEKFDPHLTIGTAHPDFVEELTKESFAPFTFHASGVALYQLGNFGTARKKVWSSR